MTGGQGIALPQGTLLQQQYRVEQVLGIGGFGITYLARDTRLGYGIAVKEYLPGELANRNENNTVRPRSPTTENDFKWGLVSFLKEAQTLAKFKHPNVVRVYNYFEANDTAYMVMEYEEGENLSVYLERSGALDESVIRKVLFPILKGLEVLHSNNVIHRDIKPSNIFLRTNGIPVLLDFGAARNVNCSHELTVVYTPRYSPPEQFDTKALQGPWTDIYALASVLYEMISGKPPVGTVQRITAFQRNRPDPLTPAAEVGKTRYTSQLLCSIDHAMSLEERDRPQSVPQWRQQLTETSTREEVSSTAPTVASYTVGSAPTIQNRRIDDPAGDVPLDVRDRGFRPKLRDEKRGAGYWLRRLFRIGRASGRPGLVRSVLHRDSTVDADMGREVESGAKSDSGATESNQVAEVHQRRKSSGISEVDVLKPVVFVPQSETVLMHAKPVFGAKTPTNSHQSAKAATSAKRTEPETAADHLEKGGTLEGPEKDKSAPAREVLAATSLETPPAPESVRPEAGDSMAVSRPPKPIDQEALETFPASVGEGEPNKPENAPQVQPEKQPNHVARIWGPAPDRRSPDSGGCQSPDVFDAHRSGSRRQSGGDVCPDYRRLESREAKRRQSPPPRQAAKTVLPEKRSEPEMAAGRLETAGVQEEDFVAALWRPVPADREDAEALPETNGEGESNKPKSTPRAQPEERPNHLAGIWGLAPSPHSPDSYGHQSPDVFDAHRLGSRRQSRGDVFRDHRRLHSQEPRHLPSARLREPETTLKATMKNEPDTTRFSPAQAKAAIYIDRGNALRWRGQEKEALEQWELALALVPENDGLREKIQGLQRLLEESATEPNPDARTPDSENMS